jgi:16S rRNA (adenine1518-N6/adenine1519-N6)-dimethyltransferase
MNQSEDLLEVVNAKNQIIGIEKRGIVHAKNLMHRSVHVVLINSDKHILLQQRAWNKDSEPGKWDTSCAGHVDPGEASLEAAERELSEELGLKGVVLEEILCLEASVCTGYEFINVFLCRENSKVSPDPEEIIDWRWCSSEELQSWMEEHPDIFTSVFKNIVTCFRELQVL